MRILFVCEGFNKYSINAQPWKHVFEVARRLQNKGHNVCVLTDVNRYSLGNEVIYGVHVKRIKKGRFLFDVEELNKSLNEGFDVINWNASGALSALHFLRVKDFVGNLIWTLHAGVIGLSDFRNLKVADIPFLGMFWNNILYSIKSDIFVKKAVEFPNLKIIVTLSRRLKNYLLSSGVKEEIVRVVYSGVDVENFAPKSEEYIEKAKMQIGLKTDESIVLYYGPLTPFRGVDELIDAIPIVSSKFQHANFVFLARTSKMDQKSRVLRERLLKLKNVILVEGVLNQKLLVKYLNIADIVVLPFRFWPYVECPLTVLEAMAVGKPLITTFMGAIPEIVQDSVNGLLVNPRAEEIGFATKKLLQNKKLASKLGKNARNYVEKFHSWDDVTEQTAAAFQECLA